MRWLAVQILRVSALLRQEPERSALRRLADELA